MPNIYERLWPLVRLANAEVAHRLGKLALRAPFPLGREVLDPFEWRGLRFRNRVGVAAGFDKNATVVEGVARLGAGFLEVGTVLVRPWSGHPRPCLERIERERAIWNRVGFSSDGLVAVRRRLRHANKGAMEIGCNVAPHPLTAQRADGPEFFDRARSELAELVRALHTLASFFVVNLSSPNTRGLRDILYASGFAEEIVAPTHEVLATLDRSEGRAHPTLLLVKLPPEDAEGRPWRGETLASLVAPLAEQGVCDGFVAVNTSAHLGLKIGRHASPGHPGGISGSPLFPLALEAQRALRAVAPNHLRIACGGVTQPADAVALLEAGAHLVEIYSGMIYRGPGLVAECAEALRDRRCGPV